MSAWGGARTMALREQIGSELPMPCSKCGRPVHDWQPWDIDHLVPRHVAPWLTWERSNMAPAHARCNRGDGGRIASRRRHGERPSRAW